MLGSLYDDFPADIAGHITLLPISDTHEREGYIVRLEKGNHENEEADILWMNPSLPRVGHV
jgi:hypothetical protein